MCRFSNEKNSEADSRREPLPHRLQQFHRIQGTARIFLVLEKRIGLQPIGQTTLDSVGQLAAFSGLVVGSPKSKINEARSTLFRRSNRLCLGNAKRNIAPLERAIRRVYEPRLVAELDCILHASRQLR